MRNIICIFGLLFFVGCAGSPMAISIKSPEELKTVPDEQLCSAYAKLKTELIARDLFTDKEWQAIEQGSVYVGMSKNAMLAAIPRIYLTNTSNLGDYGKYEEYSEPLSFEALRIYLLEGKVVSYKIR